MFSSSGVVRGAPNGVCWNTQRAANGRPPAGPNNYTGETLSEDPRSTPRRSHHREAVYAGRGYPEVRRGGEMTPNPVPQRATCTSRTGLCVPNKPPRCDPFASLQWTTRRRRGGAQSQLASTRPSKATPWRRGEGATCESLDSARRWHPAGRSTRLLAISVAAAHRVLPTPERGENRDPRHLLAFTGGVSGQPSLGQDHQRSNVPPLQKDGSSAAPGRLRAGPIPFTSVR